MGSDRKTPRRYLTMRTPTPPTGDVRPASTRFPELLAAADWSIASTGRRLAVAKLRSDKHSFEITDPPDEISQPPRLLERLAAQKQADGTALVGFDFPIGLPRQYAVANDIKGFRAGLELFESAPGWQHFYEPSDYPSSHQPFAPKSSRSRLKRGELARALGLSAESDLLRLCDRRTATRYQAESVFYLRFAKQVGRSAIQGWRDVIGPARSQVRLWPFDGDLNALLSKPGFVIAEIYPAETVTQLALLLGPGTGKSKRRKEDRAEACATLLARAELSEISMSSVVERLLESGCDSEHDFDALVSLLGMIQIVQRARGNDAPTDESVRTTEGWILGQDPNPYVPPTALRAHISRTEPSLGHRVPFVLRRVWCGPRDDQHLIDLAHPTGDGKGAINVICGPNNSGKSFLLDQIYRILKRKKQRGVINVESIPKLQPRILFLGKTWTDKDKIGIVNLDQTARALSVGGQHGDYLRSGLRFLLRQMRPHLSPDLREGLEERIIKAGVRKTIESAFVVDQQVYACDGADALVTRLQRALGANLYFRCIKRDKAAYAWQFEFVLVYGNGTTLPYEMWSDGQRALFYVLVSLEYFGPELVLYDEAENHLHPAFMSDILEELRARPVQSIITTHHPHLIFSRFADRVYYIETDRPKPFPTPPPQLSFSAQYVDFERRVEELRGGFEKISSSYKLFAHQDVQLLAQAEYVQTRSTLILIQALSHIYSYPPVSASARPLPDTQTQQLAARIQAFAAPRDNRRIEVLDLGAGLGRQVAELAKLSKWQLGAEIEWTCYEGMDASRKKLEQQFAAVEHVHIVDNLSALSEGKFDFCILANVLHELTPPEFAHYVAAADRLSRRGAGGLVVLELFPLLHPESHAVPYPAPILQEILDKAGFFVDVAQLSLTQSGTTAYCLLAKRRSTPGIIEDAVVRSSVEEAWQKLLELSLSAYAARSTPVDLGGYQALLSNLTTIASITSWRAGKWPPTWSEIQSKTTRET